MRRATKRTLTLFGVATIGVLMWPGPAGADTNLGGYSGSAVAEPLRVEIFEPTIPIPSSPQIDGGIAYTQAMTDTGPVSRALASYLWPGPVVGDGFGTLVGNDKAKYPVQVNSRNPATADSPAKNTAQLTDGNGMTTSSDNTDTQATVTGLGVAGPGTNLLGGLGAGLGQLSGSKPAKPLPDLPVPVSSTLGALATLANVKSSSDIALGKDTVTSTAQAYVSDIKLLGGIVDIGGVNIYSKSVSNGKTSSNTAVVDVADVKVAGMDLGINEKGLSLAGSTVKLPKTPGGDALAKLGISILPTQTQQTHSGPTASFGAQGLTISIDTVPLKTLLNTSAITDPIAQALSKIPKLGSMLGPVLGLGPKIVIEMGNVTTSATASPAYNGGVFPTGPSPGGTVTSQSPGGTSIPGGTVNGGGGPIAGGSGGLGGTGGSTTGSTAPGATGTNQVPVASTGFDLPPLGAVPKALILGGLALAAAVAWALRNVGGLLFGPGSGCDYGLDSGVPDLRKGQ